MGSGWRGSARTAEGRTGPLSPYLLPPPPEAGRILHAEPTREPAMDTLQIFYHGGVALFIGVLVGLQRERAQEDHPGELTFGGIRTFALLSLVGYLGALAGTLTGTAALLIAVFTVSGALVAVSYAFAAREGQVGMTTEMAALVTVLAGALCHLVAIEIAVAVAVATMALLALKVQSRRFVQRVSPADLYATVKFAVITAIVLPVLPNRTWDIVPLDMLNPRKVWLMVILISGISFLGYVLIKVVGARRGVGLTGLLGGLASSTAVTLSFAQRSRRVPDLAAPFAVAILLSWTIMFARVLVEVAVVNPPLLSHLWIPMSGVGLAGLVYCAYLFFRQKPDKQKEPDPFANPFELGPALGFGLLYAVILVVARGAQLLFGDAGLYVSSVVAGLADVDAITLSVAELTRDPESLALSTGARAIVLAVVSNTVVKSGIVAATGSPELRRAVVPGLGLILVTAALLLLVL